MLNHRRNGEAAQRAAERRQREDNANRLAADVPTLETLRLEVNERRAGSLIPEATHIKRVVVAHAPALFWLPCGDSGCKEGGHDVTYQIMRELHARSTRFEGEDACNGRLGSATCARVLHYVAIATYR